MKVKLLALIKALAKDKRAWRSAAEIGAIGVSAVAMFEMAESLLDSGRSEEEVVEDLIEAYKDKPEELIKAIDSAYKGWKVEKTKTNTWISFSVASGILIIIVIIYIMTRKKKR